MERGGEGKGWGEDRLRKKIREEISKRLEGTEGMAERYNSLYQGLLLR